MTTDQQALALAQHMLVVGRAEDALQHLSRVSSEAISSEQAWVLRAEALLTLDRPVDAATAASTGMAEVGTTVALLHVLSRARSAMGDHPAAEQALLAALRQAPEDPLLLGSYVRLLAYDGQFDKAGRVLAEADRVAPGSRAAGEARAVLAHARGDRRTAKAAARELLRDDPGSALGRAVLAGVAVESAQFRQGSRLYSSLAAETYDPDLRSSARTARAYSSFWLAPLWPIERFGPVTVWLCWLAAVFVLSFAGLDSALLVLVPIYLLFVVYSWVAPPLVRRWARR